MIIDILVLLVLAASALIAFMRGFIREVLTIVGVLGGLAAAYYGGPLLVPLMDGWLGVDPAAEEPQKLFGEIPYTYVSIGLAYGCVFIVVVVILSIISHMIAETAKSIGLGAVDRSLGVVFGLARGILLLGILYSPVYLMVDKETTAAWFDGSKTYPYIEMTSEALAEFLPEAAKKGLEEQATEEGQEGAVEKTRDTLQRLDLLEKRDGTADANGNASAAEQEKGYNDKQREQMDKLFEDIDKPEPAPAVAPTE